MGVDGQDERRRLLCNVAFKDLSAVQRHAYLAS